jgi:uncharacterized membrane protein
MRKEVLVIILLFLPIVHAQSYYADININLESAGFVTITGETDHPALLIKDSQGYLEKKQNIWTFHLEKKELFSDFVYVVNLPQGASVNYIKSSGTFRIEQGNGNLNIRGYGQNKSIDILVQYELHKDSKNTQWIIMIPIIAIALSSALYFLVHRKKKSPPKKTPEIKNLTTRQRKIVELLVKEDKPLTQIGIQEKLHIPKASVSRNIRTLELKGIIEKEKTGMSNIIRIK